MAAESSADNATFGSKEAQQMRQHRVCLEGGPQLDINDLIRRGYLKPGAATDWARIDWRN